MPAFAEDAAIIAFAGDLLAQALIDAVELDAPCCRACAFVHSAIAPRCRYSICAPGVAIRSRDAATFGLSPWRLVAFRLRFVPGQARRRLQRDAAPLQLGDVVACRKAAVQ